MTSVQLPQELLERYQRAEASGIGLWAARQFLAAAGVFRELYELLKERQPGDGRFHKGGPLHNEGVSWIYAGLPEKGAQPILLAYIEDCLSEGPRSPRVETLPAAQTLRNYFRMTDNAFETLKKTVEAQGDPKLVRDPERVYEAHLNAMGLREEEILPALGKLKDRKRNYQKFDKDWERRVFIGGAYRDPSKLESLRDVLLDLGFEPIIASDFMTPEELVRHHALMLLHSCKYAIFDLAIEAGQLMEIERSLDYEVKALALYPANDPKEEARISGMIKSHPIEKVPYKRDEERRAAVVKFLT